MAPLIILIVSFIVALALNFVFQNKYSISLLGRFALATMLASTGVSHFIKTDEMLQMMPHFLPYKIWLVYFTGVLEMGAGLGLLLRRWAKFSSIALIAFFILILPANIIGSIKRVELGGMENGPLYLFFRIPLQIFFICWTYYFGIYLLKRTSIGRPESYSHTG